MHYVYILQITKDGKFYTGSTNELKRRIQEHQYGNVTSTWNRRPLELIYYEACLNEDDAKQRETYLKSGMGKKYIRNHLKRYQQPLPRSSGSNSWSLCTCHRSLTPRGRWMSRCITTYTVLPVHHRELRRSLAHYRKSFHLPISTVNGYKSDSSWLATLEPWTAVAEYGSCKAMPYKKISKSLTDKQNSLLYNYSSFAPPMGHGAASGVG